jgi:DNA-binding NarL/FixJ family response regulator
MKLLLIDDHEVVRDGVKRIFCEQDSHTVFGEAGSIADALKLVYERAWDVALLDLTLGDRGGLELLKELRQIAPALPVVILSMHSEEQYARRAFKLGAAGYVTKDAHREELVKAVNRVIAGGRYVSPALAEALAGSLATGGDRPLHESLSAREFEVMRLIASGKTVVEIARMICLSDKTVSTYRARILHKMEMKSGAALTRYALCNKLVE